MSVGNFYNTTIPGHSIATKVNGSSDRDIKNGIQNWKRKVKDAGIIQQLKDKREFIKPSERNRAKMDRARYMQYVTQLHIDD